MFKVGCAIYYSMAELGLQSQFGHGIVHCATNLEHLYRIYSIPTHDKHQWLMLQSVVILLMDARGVQNVYSMLVVVSRHSTARVAACWFVVYYIQTVNSSKCNPPSYELDSTGFRIRFCLKILHNKNKIHIIS